MSNLSLAINLFQVENYTVILP